MRCTNIIVYLSVLSMSLFRISADLTDSLKKALPVLPAIDDSRSRGPFKLPNFLRPHPKDDTEDGDGDPDYGAFAYPAASDSKLTSFFKVLRNVEIVRCRVRDNLKVCETKVITTSSILTWHNMLL